MVQNINDVPVSRNALYVEGRDNPQMRTAELRPGDNPARIELAATPNNMPQTNPLAPTNVNDMNASDTAKGLYVDPTPIFQPSIDFIAGQRAQANERYAQNKADITNIFGNLTQVNQESQERVRQQFENSIANQQMQTAQRMAQARTGAEQTQQSALRAMDERGGGPMGNLQASPAAVAAERGIADIGSYAQIWEGQQRAIQEQTQQDLQAGLRGLGYQEVLANQTLQRSLEDTLNQLSGQEVGVRSDLAQAIYGGKSAVAQANYNEILAQKAAEEQRRLASIRGAYDVEQAQIDAQNKLDLALIEQANRVQNYENDSLGISRRLADFQIDPSTFWPTIDSIGASTMPSASAAYEAWLQSNPRSSEAERGAARDWFNTLRYSANDTGVLGSINWGSQYGLPNTGG